MEVETIAAGLSSPEWKDRVDALKSLARLAQSDRNVVLTAGIIEKVVANAKDLRSLVAAEACRAAAACASSFGGEIFVETWLDAFVSLSSGASPKVVTRAADDAARALVRASGDKASFVISKLVEGTKARAAPARRACLQYLTEACRAWPADPDVLASCVVDRARDADGAARAAARELWFALRDAGFLDEATRARELLDSSTKKQLDKEAAGRPRRIVEKRPPPPPTVAPKRPKQPVVTRTKAPPPDDEDDYDGPGPTAAHVNDLVKQAVSPHWDVRRDAILALGRGLDHEAAWKSVAVATNDPHHRVAGCALKAVARSLAGVRDEAPAGLGARTDAGTVLSAVLVAAARRHVDARLPLRTAATSVLENARRALSPGTLLTAIAPFIGDLTPLKARAALLDFAEVSIRAHSPTGLFGDLVLKLATTLKATASAPDVYSAAARCADALKSADPATFTDKVAALAPELRRAVSEALHDADFDKQLQRARSALLAKAEDEDVVAPPEEVNSLALAVADLAAEAADDDAAERASRARHAIALAAAKDEGQWRHYFDQVAMLLLERAAPRDDPLADYLDKSTISLNDLTARHESLAVLRVLARRRPRQFKHLVPAAVPRLLRVATSRSNPYEIATAAERVLYAAVDVHAKLVFSLASHDLQKHLGDPRARQEATSAPARVLGAAARATPAAELTKALPTLLPVLVALADDDRPDLRKAAVDAFVDFVLVLGDALLPKLKAHLRDDQLRLVALYVEKHQNQT